MEITKLVSSTVTQRWWSGGGGSGTDCTWSLAVTRAGEANQSEWLIAVSNANDCGTTTCGKERGEKFKRKPFMPLSSRSSIKRIWNYWQIPMLSLSGWVALLKRFLFVSPSQSLARIPFYLSHWPVLQKINAKCRPPGRHLCMIKSRRRSPGNFLSPRSRFYAQLCLLVQ